MDLAHTLLRTISRSFYSPEYILILDAILQHSCLRDDDLAAVMGSQPKHTRKLCYRLLEDGLLHKGSRAEIRVGANRATQREYYYVNLHAAIDAVKWRLKSMSKKVGERYGQSEAEKKDWVCPRCKSSFTQMEVLSTVDWEGNFKCARCGGVLEMTKQSEGESAGHEVHSRLNAQLAPFEELMRKIDQAEIPENDFEFAIAHRKEVRGLDDVDRRVKSEPVARVGAGVETTHGLKIEQEKLEVKVQDEGQSRDEEEAAKAEQAKRLAQQNALPAWYTQSTVTGDVTDLGKKEQARREERDIFAGRAETAKEEKDVKAKKDGVEESDAMREYLAALEAEKAQERAEEANEDESGSEEEDDDEFEDVPVNDEPPAKKVKFEEPAPPEKKPLTNGVSSGGESKSSSTTPQPEVKLDASGQAAVNGNAKQAEVDSDEDELEFEDA